LARSKIALGEVFATSIDSNLSDAQIIILLISADFLASSYCWSVEMTLAMKRHESGAARVIPVILRACDWHSAPVGKLLATPKDGKPVKSWPDIDEAFYDVARQTRRAVEAVKSQTISAPNAISTPSSALVSPKPQGAQPTDITQVYCSRCGTLAGSQSTCTGAHTHHSFANFGKFGAYCSRCGVTPQDQTICTGAYTHHDFSA
jgi:hypothetical protein